MGLFSKKNREKEPADHNDKVIKEYILSASIILIFIVVCVILAVIHRS